MESSTNQAKLVEAARVLFTTHGYNGVSVDDVAARAGLTKGAVYYQFADKPSLFAAACSLVVAQIIVTVTGTTMSHDIHSVDEILIGSDQLFEAYQRDDARRLLLLEGPAVLGSARWATIVAPMREELAQHALQHIADEGLLDQALVAPMADLITGAFNQAVLLASAPGSTPASILSARAAYKHLVSGLLTRR